MLLMDVILRLTGAVDTQTEALLLLPLDSPINLRGVVFAGVIFGAVGAIMDVAMSISSALWEVKRAGTGTGSSSGLFKSGMNIGKDLMGTMFSTLILAYIGSSLSMLLIITLNNISMAQIFTREIIIVEFLRGLIGGVGMLLAIPLTAGACARVMQDV